jgi:HD-GYP domain-containing protein (c-di-GMP phosphodiesterase class II)
MARREKKPDYRRELESAAKQMILIHRMDTLIRLILRTIMRNLAVKHVGFLLYDKEKDIYVAKFSRGSEGLKIPSGFVKISKDNSLIKYFNEPSLQVCGSDYVLLDKINNCLKNPKFRKREMKSLLEGLKFQLSLYNAVACVPGFFRERLLCVLLLGRKKNHKKFTKEELGFLSVLSSDVVMAIQNAWYFQDLEDQLRRNKRLLLQTALALATAIEAKDAYTSGHTERVSVYSIAVANEMRKTRNIQRKAWDDFMDNLQISAMLHDIGKIGVKEAVLNKNGALDEAEFEQMQEHALVGYAILRQIDQFQAPLLGVKYHHERYDGQGYPEKLKGRQIPLIAQVISVADTYDAMTTDRPYRKGLSKEEAARVIWENRGKQFSPVIVDAFLRAYKKGNL